MHALIKDGECVRTHDFGGAEPPTLHPSKGVWVVVTETEAPVIEGVVVIGSAIDQDGIRRWETRPESVEETKARVNNLALLQLGRIDIRAARPLRAILAAQAAGAQPNPADVEILLELEAEADAVRSGMIA